MSNGSSAITHLKYLHSGLQESTQRQLDEFDGHVQTHFDWLTSFQPAEKDTATVYVLPNDLLSYLINFASVSDDITDLL
jgi:hypothetical protein